MFNKGGWFYKNNNNNKKIIIKNQCNVTLYTLKLSVFFFVIVYFLNTSEICRTGHDDVSHTRMRVLLSFLVISSL